MKEKFLRGLVILLILTVGTVATGFILWGCFATLGYVADAVCTGLVATWNLVCQKWQIMLIIVGIVYVLLVIADVIDNNRKK